MLEIFLDLLKTTIFNNKCKHNDIKKSKDKNGNNEIISQWPSDSAHCAT
jgi:hypothetical protein